MPLIIFVHHNLYIIIIILLISTCMTISTHGHFLTFNSPILKRIDGKIRSNTLSTINL